MTRRAKHVSQETIDSPGDETSAEELLLRVGETLPAMEVLPEPEMTRAPLSERLFVALLAVLAIASTR